jgi:hypothetical protein
MKSLLALAVFSVAHVVHAEIVTVPFSAVVTSALSQLNFGVDRFEFTAGIADLHLPIDAALGVVDVG